MTPDTPSFSEVIENAIADRLDELHVAEPAEVVAFDPATLTCSARPLVTLPYTAEDGTTQYATRPAIHLIPIAYPGPITFPLAKGDQVLLVYASTSIQNWILDQGTKPRYTHRHNLNDAIAIPRLVPTRGAHRKSRGDATKVAPDATTIHGNVRLGSADASKRVALATNVEDALKGALSDPGIAAAIAGIAAPGGSTALEVAVNLYFATHHVAGATKVYGE